MGVAYDKLEERHGFEEGTIYPITWWPLCILMELSETRGALLYDMVTRSRMYMAEDVFDSVVKLDIRLKNIKLISPDTLKIEIEDAGGLMSYWDRLDLEVSDQSRFANEVQAVKSAILAVILRVFGSAPTIAEWLKSEINKKGLVRGDSLIFRAVASGVPETVDLLLVHGADLLQFDAIYWYRMAMDTSRGKDMVFRIALHIFLRSLPKSVFIEASPSSPVRTWGRKVWTKTITPLRLLQSNEVTWLGPQNVRASELTWIHIPRNNVSVRRLFIEDNPTKLDRVYSYLYDKPSAL
jgi:hypothetical protein